MDMGSAMGRYRIEIDTLVVEAWPPPYRDTAIGGAVTLLIAGRGIRYQDLGLTVSSSVKDCRPRRISSFSASVWALLMASYSWEMVVSS